MHAVRTIPLLIFGTALGCNVAGSKIKPMAASELRCPETEISVKPVRRTQMQQVHDDLVRTPPHQVARGCGGTAYYVEQCPPDVRQGSSKCNWVSLAKLKTDSVLRRAAFDFQCDARELHITWLDRSTTGINGCGKRATYVLNCADDTGLWSSGCKWVLNTDAMAQSPIAAQPPPPPAAPPPAAPPPPAPATAPTAPAETAAPPAAAP